MAYDVNEERLKVRGSEQITRDLKVNRDLFVNGTTDTKKITVEDDATVKGEAIFEDDVAIHGDLYVEGTTTTTSEAQVSSSGNYVVTRDNNATPLATGEYSGLAVNNYATGKIATITADKDGTWRISDSATASATTYTNISAYNGVYYTGLTQTVTTGPSGILTNVDADELASVVLYGTDYYHKSGADWFGPVTLSLNALDAGVTVTDPTLIATLNGLTKHDLVYYRSATDKTIDASTNQPLLTRAEASNLTGGQALTWDATNEKAVGKTIDTTVTANSSNLITSGAVNTAITNAVNALDVSSVGGAGKYISAISETNGKISATATTMDTAPTASSTNAVTSGGVKTAIDNEATARNTAITNAINALDVTDTAVSGKYVSAVSETNGKISVTRADLPNTINNAKSLNGYVTCTTAAGTAAKTVDLAGFTLHRGAKLVVYVQNANTAASALTLNVNGTGAKTIKINGTVTSSSSYSLTAQYYNCYYDGTNWCMNTYEANSAISASNSSVATQADYTRGNAYCTTAAGTAAKVVSMRGYVLATGGAFPITFTNANSAASKLTLDINSKGAKDLWINGAVTSSTNHTLPAGTYICYYDGTKYMIDTEYAVPSARAASANVADFIRGSAPSTSASGSLSNNRLSYGILHIDSTNSTRVFDITTSKTTFTFPNTLFEDYPCITYMQGANGSYYFGLIIPAPIPGGKHILKIAGDSYTTISTSTTASGTNVVVTTIGNPEGIYFKYIKLGGDQ